MRNTSQESCNRTDTLEAVPGESGRGLSCVGPEAGALAEARMFVGQVVFDAAFDEDDCCRGVARLEVVIVRATSWDEANVALAEFGRARSEASVEMPQGEATLKFAGIRDVREVDASMPASGALLADFALEMHGAGTGRRLVRREPVECMFDW